EIAAIIGDGINNFEGEATRESVQNCIEKYVPAIEVIDMRGTQIKDTPLPKAVALNIFNAGCVLGNDGIAPEDLNLESITTSIKLNGEPFEKETNNAPQHPLDAVAWLMKHLKNRPFKLKPGMVVLCGTHIPIQYVPAHAKQIDIAMSGLGTVSMSLSGSS
ncbi:MAG: fumarylacetoacetate hydrolase family protein, partial [Rhizobiaceae bacterium]